MIIGASTHGVYISAARLYSCFGKGSIIPFLSL